MRARRLRVSGAPSAPATALAAGDYDEMWSRLADFLRYNPGSRHRRRLVLRALRRHVPRTTEVLDVGCGLGEMVAYLSHRLPHVRFTGVDFSRGAIESCRRRMPAQQWQVADIVADDLVGTHETVICSELLEHLDDPAAALARIARSVAPGGTLIVTVPNGKVFATERAVGHVRHPTLTTLRDWFATAGLDLVAAKQWGFPGYLALKYAINIVAERALDAFGSGRYSWVVRRANDLAYLATGALSLPTHSRGPQTIVVGRRPGETR